MLENDNHLSTSVLKIVTDLANTLLVSAASLFEITIKTKIGKLNARQTTTELVDKMGRLDIILLPIRSDHLDAYQTVPLFEDHRDPFDRLLIATALSEGIAFISIDGKLDRYANLITLIR